MGNCVGVQHNDQLENHQFLLEIDIDNTKCELEQKYFQTLIKNTQGIPKEQQQNNISQLLYDIQSDISSKPQESQLFFFEGILKENKKDQEISFKKCAECEKGVLDYRPIAYFKLAFMIDNIDQQRVLYKQAFQFTKKRDQLSMEEHDFWKKFLTRLEYIQLLSYLQKYDESVTEISQFLNSKEKLNVEQKVKAYYLWGNILICQKKFKEAVSKFQMCIKHDKGYCLAYNNMSYSLNELKEYKQAIVYLKKCIKINPNFLFSYYNYGESLKNQNKIEEALYMYNKVIKIDPNQSYTYFYIGQFLGKLDRNDEALQNYQKSIDLDPTNAVTQAEIGYIHIKTKQFKQAVGAFQRSIELDPKCNIVHFNLAYSYLKLKRIQKAVHHYGEACYLQPSLINEMFQDQRLKTQVIMRLNSKVRNDFDVRRLYVQMVVIKSSQLYLKYFRKEINQEMAEFLLYRNKKLQFFNNMYKKKFTM